MRKINRIALFYVFILSLVLCAPLSMSAGTPPAPSLERAEQRVKDFIFEINYNYKKPEMIYPFLRADLRERMSEGEFRIAFFKERSYPYLSPLFLLFRSIDLSEDQRNGIAHFEMAARLPGMMVEFPIVYENGDYYMEYFTDFPDGSYLEKFDRIPNYLINGWN